MNNRYKNNYNQQNKQYSTNNDGQKKVNFSNNHNQQNESDYDSQRKVKFSNNYNQHNQHNQHNQQNKFNNEQSYSQFDDKKRDIFIGHEIDIELKSELLDYLYQNVDIYQLRYTIMKTTEHAQILTKQLYHITPHFHGYNYYLIFKKLSTSNIVNVYLVYKLNLKFTRQETNDDSVKVYCINVSTISNLSIDVYDNTIIDGKLVFKQEQKLFLINDVLYFKNSKYLTFKLEEKFENINSDINIFNELFKNTFNVKIIKLYKNSDMNDLIYNKIRNSDFKINGITFLPIRSNRVYIYINDNEFDSIKNSPNLEITSNVTNIKISQYTNIDEKELLLQKTQIVDVYEVFTIDKVSRFGIASVPNIILSHKLRNYFKINDQLITKCIFDNKSLKWLPLIDNIN